MSVLPQPVEFDPPAPSLSVPVSPQTERAVLGCIFSHPKLIGNCAGDLAAEAFHDLRHRNIFEAMVTLFESGKPVSEIGVREAVGDDSSVGGLAYMCSLTDSAPSPHSFEYYIELLQQKLWLREVQGAAIRLQGLTNSHETEGVADEIERSLSALISRAGGDEGGEVPIKEAVGRSIASMEAAMKNDGSLGVPTGFPALNHLTAGLRAGDYWIVAARPSVGKTSLAMNIAEYAAVEKNIPVGILSMEMTAESLATRMISGRARVDAGTIRDGRFTAEQIKKITVAAAPISSAPLFIDQTPSLTDTQILSRARSMKARHGIRLLVVDYIQLAHARVGTREQRWREVALVSAALKRAAKENDIAVLALSQLSRDVESSVRAPKLSDLRESGSLEQDADVVGLLHRPDEDKDWNFLELCIAKQRNGRTGVVQLDFIPNETRFVQHMPELG
tara:strand:+ start:450 stop:1790 length:1341 start_codon:yes stop_codon:yes gene_type:complete